MSAEVLVVTGGHPFAADPFFAALDSTGLAWEHVPHPEARRRLSPEGIGAARAVLLYDLPGVEFQPGAAPRTPEPPPEVVEGLGALLDAGTVGVVALHHALAGWPTWPEYAEWLGGRYHYVPGTVRGVDWPESGFRFDVRQRLSPVDLAHPVLAGLEDGFEVVDEPYCCPVFAQDVVPLLTTDAPTDPSAYEATLPALAVRGMGDPAWADEDRPWPHPPAVPLAAWATTARRSPLVYIQPGDGPGAFGSDGWRRLLANALRWVGGLA